MDDLQPEGVQSAELVRAPKQVQMQFARGISWQAAKQFDCFEADRASQRSHSLRMVCTLESAHMADQAIFYWRSF